MTIAPAAPQDYTLGAGDTFEVTVYGEEDLSGKYRIAEDGTINFPLVGRIAVGGKPPGEIANSIQTALLEKNILRDPHVSVFMLEQTSKHVALAGSVAKPGSYPLTAGMTVIDAISAAGGLSSLASGNNTIVTRRVDGKLQRYTVEVEKIIEGKAEDFSLQDGDIVYVPERVF
ncbi:MAG TPA: polysaccharide biosynthesis/export family protein [Polyangiaceae bacterium]|nr:polysaccharide biosynthesis/export family protein [Polyangiaceae bacterium]